MFKKNLGSALGISLGITLGGVIIPRIYFTPQAFTTYPPLLHHILLYFTTTFLASFIFFVLMEKLGKLDYTGIVARARKNRGE